MTSLPSSVSPSSVPYLEIPIVPGSNPRKPSSSASQERGSLPLWENPPTSKVWGLDFHALTMEQTVDAMDRWIARRAPGYAITANLNYAMLCDRDPKLRELTRDATFVLCDGMPIYWRSRCNAIPLPERVAGADLIYHLAERCAEKGYRIYFYGAGDGIAEATAETLVELYPGLQVAGWQSPPYGETTAEELQSSMDHIRKAKPDVLLAALGQPKGEYWIQRHYQSLEIPLSMQVGASFDFVAGVWNRAPWYLQRTGLEWLHRACSDPKRLIPRYFRNLMFLVKALRRDGIDALS
jgi:N-acetylglucosaminyldiphosphoundecaprenol N-acetyl-beta-D-mannosaminyltransferase